MKHIAFGLIYELCLTALVILSLILDLPPAQGAVLDWFIWSIFFLDFAVRIARSEHKWRYIREHPLDFIAVLPLDQVFRTARFVRVIRLLRLLMILNRRTAFFEQLLKKYKIDSLIVFVMSMLFIVSLPMKWIEPSFHTYGDAIWWAIVTMTTVGYGDLSPQTTVGRIIAAVLMLSGIGIIGVVTGTVASVVTGSTQEDLPKELKDVHAKISEYPQLDQTDYDYMIEKLKDMKKQLDEGNI